MRRIRTLLGKVAAAWI